MPSTSSRQKRDYNSPSLTPVASSALILLRVRPFAARRHWSRLQQWELKISFRLSVLKFKVNFEVVVFFWLTFFALSMSEWWWSVWPKWAAFIGVLNERDKLWTWPCYNVPLLLCRWRQNQLQIICDVIISLRWRTRSDAIFNYGLFFHK